MVLQDVFPAWIDRFARLLGGLGVKEPVLHMGTQAGASRWVGWVGWIRKIHATHRAWEVFCKKCQDVNIDSMLR